MQLPRINCTPYVSAVNIKYEAKEVHFKELHSKVFRQNRTSQSCTCTLAIDKKL